MIEVGGFFPSVSIGSAALFAASAGESEAITVAAFDFSTPVVALSIVCVSLWFYAGLQTWRLMFLLDPQQDSCELTHLMRHGQLPTSVFVLFILFWPFLLGAIQIVDWVAALNRVAK